MGKLIEVQVGWFWPSSFLAIPCDPRLSVSSILHLFSCPLVGVLSAPWSWPITRGGFLQPHSVLSHIGILHRSASYHAISSVRWRRFTSRPVTLWPTYAQG